MKSSKKCRECPTLNNIRVEEIIFDSDSDDSDDSPFWGDSNKKGKPTNFKPKASLWPSALSNTRDRSGQPVTHFFEHWQTITMDQWILDVIKFGYRLDFESQLPLITSLRPCLILWKRTLEEEVKSMLEKNAIKEVSEASYPGFLGAQEVGQFSTCNGVSKIAICTKFKMETPRYVASYARSSYCLFWLIASYLKNLM